MHYRSQGQAQRTLDAEAATLCAFKADRGKTAHSSFGSCGSCETHNGSSLRKESECQGSLSRCTSLASCFAHLQRVGSHPVEQPQTKRCRHLNFFQHECFLEFSVLRVKQPDGRVLLIEPDWAGKLAGFTLLFAALVLMLWQQMLFDAVARLVGESWHRVHAICSRYVRMAAEIEDGIN